MLPLIVVSGLLIVLGLCAGAVGTVEVGTVENKIKTRKDLKKPADPNNYTLCPLIQVHIMCHGKNVTDYSSVCMYDRVNYTDDNMLRLNGIHCPFRKNNKCVLVEFLDNKE